MKTIIIIDDTIRHVENLIVTVGAILMKSPPTIEEEKRIVFLHVIKDRVSADGSKTDARLQISNENDLTFSEIKQSVLRRLDIKPDQAITADQISLEYRPMLLTFSSDPTGNATTIEKEIQGLIQCQNSPDSEEASISSVKNAFVVLLDIILFSPDDVEHIAEECGSAESENPTDDASADNTSSPKEILSHRLYKEYSKNCLLYSTYPPQAILDKWCKIANLDKDASPYQFGIIANGRAIYVPFKKALLEKLAISNGGSRND